MSAEPIHALGLPKKHKLTAEHLEDVLLSSLEERQILAYLANKWRNVYVPCFWGRREWVTQFGTVGDNRISGDGNPIVDRDFYVNYGAGDAGGRIHRLLDVAGLIKHNMEWETATWARRDYSYCDRVFMLCEGLAALNCHLYTDAGVINSKYGAIWMVRDATYDHRILAVTRNYVTEPPTVTISNLGAWSTSYGCGFRIEYDDDNLKIRYFWWDDAGNGSRKTPAATHDAPNFLTTNTCYIKIGLCTRVLSAYDNEEVYYWVRGISDYD